MNATPKIKMTKYLYTHSHFLLYKDVHAALQKDFYDGEDMEETSGVPITRKTGSIVMTHVGKLNPREV